MCTHFESLHPFEKKPRVCEDCVKIGARWVHLRQCRVCGHVACCDSSPNRHATAHFRATGHAVVQSYEPGEDWGWCYVDEEFVEHLRG
ncbi:MAG: UBP-type zinc finger domain-containing protein [Vicinamibacterales bacterium]